MLVEPKTRSSRDQANWDKGNSTIFPTQLTTTSRNMVGTQTAESDEHTHDIHQEKRIHVLRSAVMFYREEIAGGGMIGLLCTAIIPDDTHTEGEGRH